MKQFFEIEEEVEKKSFFNLKENNETKVPDWINDLSLLKSRYYDLKYKLDKINFIREHDYDKRLQYLLALKYYSSEFWLLINNFKKEHEDLKSFVNHTKYPVLDDEEFKKIPDSLKLLYLEEGLSRKFKLSDLQQKFYFDSLKTKYKNIQISNLIKK
jgi:hypothetical protein